eukprot:1072871-Alexandrium_andersonii.AAC.1
MLTSPATRASGVLGGSAACRAARASARLSGGRYTDMTLASRASSPGPRINASTATPGMTSLDSTKERGCGTTTATPPCRPRGLCELGRLQASHLGLRRPRRPPPRGANAFPAGGRRAQPQGRQRLLLSLPPP